ncbi:MAG TPA: hypothetical protein DCG19_00705, partial [Cryomorphaceae bacterium]|nr:hypothetical protein [Cryomorphaceae bacterium]
SRTSKKKTLPNGPVPAENSESPSKSVDGDYSLDYNAGSKNKQTEYATTFEDFLGIQNVEESPDQEKPEQALTELEKFGLEQSQKALPVQDNITGQPDQKRIEFLSDPGSFWNEKHYFHAENVDPKVLEIGRKKDLTEEDQEFLQSQLVSPGFYEVGPNENAAGFYLSRHAKREEQKLEALRTRTENKVEEISQTFQELNTQFEQETDPAKREELVNSFARQKQNYEALVEDYQTKALLASKRIQSLQSDANGEYAHSVETFFRAAGDEINKTPQYLASAGSTLLYLIGEGVKLAPHLGQPGSLGVYMATGVPHAETEKWSKALERIGDDLYQASLEGSRTNYKSDRIVNQDTAKTLGTATGQMVSIVAAGYLTGGTGALAMGFGMGADEMYQSAKSQGIDDKDARLLGAATGLIYAGLEKFGADQVTKKLLGTELKSQVIDYLIKKGVFEIAEDRLKAEAIKTGIREFVPSGILAKELAKRGKEFMVETGKAGLIEGVTEGLQSIAFDGIQNTYNLLEGEKRLNAPSMFSPEMWQKAYENAKSGLMAGAFLGGTVNLGQLSATSRDGYHLAMDFATDDQSFQLLSSEIQKREDLSQEQKIDLQDKISTMRETAITIPENIPEARRQQIFSLLYQKKQLQRTVEGKDDVFVKDVEEKTKELDDQIKKLLAPDYALEPEDTQLMEALNQVKGDPSAGGEYMAVRNRLEDIDHKLNSGFYQGRKERLLKRERTRLKLLEAELKSQFRIPMKTVPDRQRTSRGKVYTGENIQNLKTGSRKTNRLIKDVLQIVPGMNIEVFDSPSEMQLALSEIKGEYWDNSEGYIPETNTLFVTKGSEGGEQLYNELAGHLLTRLENQDQDHFQELLKQADEFKMKDPLFEEDKAKAEGYFQWATEQHGKVTDGQLENPQEVAGAAFTALVSDRLSGRLKQTKGWKSTIQDMARSLGISSLFDRLNEQGKSLEDLEVREYTSLGDLIHSIQTTLRNSDPEIPLGRSKKSLNEANTENLSPSYPRLTPLPELVSDPLREDYQKVEAINMQRQQKLKDIYKSQKLGLNKRTRIQFEQAFTNRAALFNQNLKEISKGATRKVKELAEDVVTMRDLAAGSQGRAEQFTSKAFQELWGVSLNPLRPKLDNGLTPESYRTLNDMISHVRNVEISLKAQEVLNEVEPEIESLQTQIRQTRTQLETLENSGINLSAKNQKALQQLRGRLKKDKSELKELQERRDKYADLEYEGGLLPDQSQAWLDYMQLQKPEYFKDLMGRANKYFDYQKQLVEELHKEGLLNDAQAQELHRFKYSPRFYIDHLFDDELKGEIAGQQGKIAGSNGVRGLKGGSEKLLYNDSEWLLSNAAKSTFKRIAVNRASKAIYDLASEHSDNGIFKIVEPIGKDRYGTLQYPEESSTGHEIVPLYRDGQKYAVEMPIEMANQLRDKKKGITDDYLTNAIQIVGGVKVLKAMATGYNPLFAAANFARDVGFSLFFTDHYSSHLPLAAIQLMSDIGKNIGARTMQRPNYSKAVEEGILMNFLTTQGMVKAGKGQSKTVKSYWNEVGKMISYLGESSELVMRLALRDRSIKNQTKALQKELQSRGENRELNDQEQKAIQFRATHEARNFIDFNQGGHVSKSLDNFLPYFNAAIQGTRSGIKHAKKNPSAFIWKQAQLGILTMLLYEWNKNQIPDLEDRIHPKIREKNFIIATPWKDENGEYRYFTIPKSHELAPLTTLYEDLYRAGTDEAKMLEVWNN